MAVDLKEKIEDVKELVPELYEDGAKPVVKETGKTLSIIPQTINAALVPLRKWIVGREYSLKETEVLLAKKLEKVKSDNIVEPEAHIAVPAIQSISYCMNNVELRNLYANLLANSMNKDMKDDVHPSFVNIINQMSPMDAIIYKIIYESKIRPLITLFFEFDGNKGKDNYLYNVSWISQYDYNIVSISIDNLMRMGLIKIPEDKHYVNDNNYAGVRKNTSYSNYYNKYENVAGGKVAEEKQIILITDYGDLFYKICVKDI